MTIITAALVATSAIAITMVFLLTRALLRRDQSHAAQVGELLRQLTEKDRALDDVRRTRRDLEAAAALVLERLADHVEKRVGHTDAVLVAETIAGNARRGWWEISARDRAMLSSLDIESGDAGAGGVVDVAAVALELADHLLRTEFQNADVARMCQITPHGERAWLAEVMSRLERICGSRQQAAQVLQNFLQVWRTTDDVRFAAQVLDWHAASRVSAGLETSPGSIEKAEQQPSPASF